MRRRLHILIRKPTYKYPNNNIIMISNISKTRQSLRSLCARHYLSNKTTISSQNISLFRYIGQLHHENASAIMRKQSDRFMIEYKLLTLCAQRKIRLQWSESRCTKKIRLLLSERTKMYTENTTTIIRKQHLSMCK